MHEVNRAFYDPLWARFGGGAPGAIQYLAAGAIADGEFGPAARGGSGLRPRVCRWKRAQHLWI